MVNVDEFNHERKINVSKMVNDDSLMFDARRFFCDTASHNYSYNFDWLSRPIIQYPQDIVAFQEVVWEVKPDLIIEMGVARGGSLILSASLLAMIDLCESGSANLVPDNDHPRCVLGVDIDIRSHNREALERHPLYPRIKLIEGSSIDQLIIDQVKSYAE